MDRTIFHVDMDAFYASIEQRDHPAYKGLPVIVGADPRAGSGRGVVAACSYEARRFGVHSALPISTAFRRCPDGVYLRPDMARYQSVSRQIRGVFRSYTPWVEPLSIDEAFLDLSETVPNDERALQLARELKRRISDECRLTASVGIAPNKFVAKIASDLKKPDGLVQVQESKLLEFLDPLPIGRLWGVGPRTEEKLKTMQISRIGDLRRFERSVLIQRFGKAGDHLWKLSNGLDNRPILTNHQPKSVGHETTFSEDITNMVKLESTLRSLSEKVSRRLKKHGLSGKTVTLKLRYSDFTTLTRQVSFRDPVCNAPDIYRVIHKLLHRHRDPERKVRLIGVSLSALEDDSQIRQLRLF
jgi:nucleotidyltransferase/DNA polymerase involved in DNA repair